MLRDREKILGEVRTENRLKEIEKRKEKER